MSVAEAFLAATQWKDTVFLPHKSKPCITKDRQIGGQILGCLHPRLTGPDKECVNEPDGRSWVGAGPTDCHSLPNVFPATQDPAPGVCPSFRLL